MDVKYLIADSGGSSTNWALVLANGEVRFLHTASLHPKYAFSEGFDFSELREHFGELNVPLYFYGAGCSGEAVQEKMKTLLLQFGFSRVEVYPDTLAACRALYGNSPGWVAILGTGSVLVQYDGSQITRRTGGYGSLVGDEGSGFYFGKLLVRHLLGTADWKPEWTALFGSRERILSKLAAPDAQQWISGLAGETAGLDFEALHRKNAELFLELYCLPDAGLREISFIGTYGYAQQTVFSEVFEGHSIHVKKAIAGPIADLAAYHQTIE
jgi:hypothetical protein